ncbi:MAG TPA: hypothetical protein VGL88_10265 [Pseudonocardiaceae bacterium]|jgi:hypothetical protein
MPRFTIFLAVQVIVGHTMYAAILTLAGLGALLVAPSIMRRPR